MEKNYFQEKPQNAVQNKILEKNIWREKKHIQRNLRVIYDLVGFTIAPEENCSPTLIVTLTQNPKPNRGSVLLWGNFSDINLGLHIFQEMFKSQNQS